MTIDETNFQNGVFTVVLIKGNVLKLVKFENL